MLIALLLAAAVAAGPSPQPHPAQRQAQSQQVAQSHQAKPEIDKRGTPSSPFVVAVPRTEQEEKEHADQARDEHWTAIRDWALIALTGVLTVATVALAVFTYRLWDATAAAVRDASTSIGIANDTLEHARENAKRELRAYLHPLEAIPEWGVDGKGRYLIFTMTIRNFGDTPASKVKTFIGARISDNPLVEELPTMAFREGSGMPLGPLADMVMTTNIRVGSEDMSAIQSKKKAIYVWGGIDYEDAFKVARHTKYRMFCTGKRNLARGNLSACADGNDAT